VGTWPVRLPDVPLRFHSPLQIYAHASKHIPRAGSLMAVQNKYRFYNPLALQVKSIEGLPAGKPSTRIYSLRQGSVLVVEGVNASTDPAWHHAGAHIHLRTAPEILLPV